MMTNNDKAALYDVLLHAPGMSELVKLNTAALSKKLVLLLSQIVEAGLEEKQGNEILVYYPPEAAADLRSFINECLEKAGLGVFSQKLQNLK